MENKLYYSFIPSSGVSGHKIEYKKSTDPDLPANWKSIELITPSVSNELITGTIFNLESATDYNVRIIPQNSSSTETNFFLYNSVTKPTMGVNASIGSDPHIYQYKGSKYDIIKPSNRNLYNIFNYKDIKMLGHFTGYKGGIFFDKVTINNSTINFNKRSIKIKDDFIKQGEKEECAVIYNHNGNRIQPKYKMDTLIIHDNNKPILKLFVDYNTKYVHMNMLQDIEKDKVSGMLNKK